MRKSLRSRVPACAVVALMAGLSGRANAQADPTPRADQVQPAAATPPSPAAPAQPPAVANGAHASATVPAADGQAVPAPSGGSAQGTATDDIVVTAQRREERLSRAPLAVTALTGDSLAKEHITDAQSLAAVVPSFNFGTYGGTARLAIRGVGLNSINEGAEGRVAYYTDGVYFSRPATALSGFYDVARVEVLRGPQGTLYGRNATGGAINVITADPTDQLTGFFTETIGEYSLFREEGAISGPISDTVSARLAINVENHDGYGRNTVTGNDVDNAATQSIRAKIRFKPNSGLSLLLAFDYHHENDRDYGGHYGGLAYPQVFPVDLATLISPTDHGGQVPPTIRDFSSALDPSNKRDFYGVSLTVDKVLSFGDLKSITAFRYSNYTDRYPDGLGDAAPLTNAERSRQISEELQLSGASTALKWVGGLYLFHEQIDGEVNIPLAVALLNILGIPAPASPNGYARGYWAGGRSDTDTVAGYGQITWTPVPRLELTGGLRVAWERHIKSDANQFAFDPYVSPNPLVTSPGYNNVGGRGSEEDTSVTPKATVSYHVTADDTIYATVAKGYKSGGFDLGAVQPAYRPETLWDYEAGIKLRLLGGRVQTNFAGFYYDYTDLQVSVIRGETVFTQNAASARTYGAEAEMQALLATGLRLDLSGSYLDAKFNHFVTANTDLTGAPVLDYAGFTLPQSPKFHGQAGLEYTYQLARGAVRLRGDVNYTSRVYFSPFDVQTVSQGRYAKGDLSLDYLPPTGKWQVGFYVKNITDRTTIASATANSFLASNSLLAYLDPPRTIGGYFTVKF